MIEQVIGWLNTNSGAVVAAATVTYAVVTLALLLEARRTRLLVHEAAVELVAQPWEEGGMWLSIAVQNYGPANARDLRYEITLVDSRGNTIREYRLHDPVFPVGRNRTIVACSSPPTDQRDIDRLIADGATLDAHWSWLDGRGKAHRRSKNVSVTDIATAYRGSGALVQPDWRRDLRKIRERLERKP